MATSWTPRRKTRVRRADLVRDAKRSATRYRNLMSSHHQNQDQASVDRVNALLWAIAKLNRALALETNGNLGDETSTPRILAQHGGQWRQAPIIQIIQPDRTLAE